MELWGGGGTLRWGWAFVKGTEFLGICSWWGQWGPGLLPSVVAFQREGNSFCSFRCSHCDLPLCHRPWNSGVSRSWSKICETTTKSNSIPLEGQAAWALWTHYTHTGSFCNVSNRHLRQYDFKLSFVFSALQPPQLIFMPLYYQNLGYLVINHLRWWLWIMCSHWWYQKMDPSGRMSVWMQGSVFSTSCSLTLGFFFLLQRNALDPSS